MKVATIRCPKVWTLISQVDDGDLYYIQNLGHYHVEYCVATSLPADSDEGGCLLPKEQLKFKKVAGSLYMRTSEIIDLYIEKVE